MATTKTNLFNKAKREGIEKSRKEDKKITLDANDDSFFNNIQTLEKLNDQMKKDKARADMISDEIRDIAKERWLELFQKTGRNPESVFIESKNELGDIASVMLIPTDKYITIDGDRADVLREQFGEEIVDEKTEFSFDNNMVEKYGSVISELIQSCVDIEESDKDRFIKSTTKFSVAKGTIDKLKTYGEVSEVFASVRPIVMLKGVEVIKG